MALALQGLRGLVAQVHYCCYTLLFRGWCRPPFPENCCPPTMGSTWHHGAKWKPGELRPLARHHTGFAWLLYSLTHRHRHPTIVLSALAGMEKTQRASVNSKGLKHPQAPLLRLGARVAAVRSLGGGTSPQDGKSSPSDGASAPRSDVATTAAGGVREVLVGPLFIWRQAPPQLGVELRKEGPRGRRPDL